MDLKKYLEKKSSGSRVVERTPSEPLMAEVEKSLKREFKIEVFDFYTKLCMEILIDVIKSYYITPLSLESKRPFISLNHNGEDISILHMDCKIYLIVSPFEGGFYRISTVIFDENLESDVPFTLADFEYSKPFFPKEMN